MSQQSPIGFGFGVLVEIAAVVAIVAVLPRIDLRPPNTAQAAPAYVQAVPADAPDANAPISPVGWTALDIRNGEATRVAPYYEPVTPTPPSAPHTGSFTTRPSLVPPPDNSQAHPNYVADRLDRASQQLVNSVASTASVAGNAWTQAQKPGQSTSIQRAPKANSTTAPHRPWLRY